MSRNRSLFGYVLALSLGVLSARGGAPHWTKPYNIVWTEPGTNGLSSMPAGGGNLGLNVWAQTNAVLFYIGSPDSFDANEVLTKLARLRVTVSPNPFAVSLRQELDLESNTVLVSGRTAEGGLVSLRIWADAHQPVVHVEGTASAPVQVTATLELDNAWNMTAGPSDNGVLWSRRAPAPSAYRDNLIAAWGMTPIADKLPDTLSNLTCGGLLLGAGFAPGAAGTGTNEGRACSTAPLATVAPVTNFAVRAVLRMAQDASLAAWTNAVRTFAAQTEATQAADRATNVAWWAAFWDRSRIVINPDGGDTNDPAWQVGRNYQLFRAMQAANSAGKFPTFFNGGFFTCRADPDLRAWAYCRFMGQNQRHIYWPLLKSGDADVLRVGTDFYARNATSRNEQIKYKLGVDGVGYNESITTMGFGTAPATNGLTTMYPYYFTAGLEFAMMMVEAHRYFGADLQPCLPAIEGTARFYDTFYRNENKKRTGSELNAQGQLVIYPANSCESTSDKTNPADSLSGLIALSEAVLALPSGTVPPETRAYFEGFRQTLPPLDTHVTSGYTVISDSLGAIGPGGIGNGENPALYSVYPFGLYGVGKGNLDLARDTWYCAGEFTKAAYCWWYGNAVVARLGLVDAARTYALAKWRFPLAYNLLKGGWWNPGDPPTRTRFPALFDGGGGVGGAGPCDIPDMDHGGSAMTGLQDMLLQTDGARLLLLPAWPADWDVDFKLHAPDQTTVAGTVRGGRLTSLTVEPESRRGDVEVQAPYVAPALPYPLACAMTEPASLALVTSGSEVSLAATATVVRGSNTVQKVEFFLDGVKLGEDTAPPYACAWSFGAPGCYAVTARARDSGGLTAVSAPVYVVATASGTWEGMHIEGGKAAYYTEGGTNWTAHIFTSNGTLNVTGSGPVEYLVIAGGGGGGGGHHGGGGGAGGVRIGRTNLAEAAYTITVGAGGSGCRWDGTSEGSNGQPSSISTGGVTIVSATGGGRAYAENPNQSAAGGGSGGGSGRGYAAGTAVGGGELGNGGGTGPELAGYACGGGGGAGSVGGAPSANTPGAGGAGTNLILSGKPVTYAAGGKGGYSGYKWSYAYTGASGPANTGNGGEGAGGGGGTGIGGNGGSGIVIVRYVTGTSTSTYTVVYSGNGADNGTAPDSQVKTQNLAMVVADNTGNLVKTGYTFVGWNTAADGTGTNYAPGASYTANASATLYAQWANTPPTITEQPSNATLTVTQFATFRVGASGPTPLFYQWYRNEAAIGGATASTYTTSAATTNDNGAAFKVTVTNVYGAVTSSVATLTVTPYPGVSAAGGTVTNYISNGTNWAAHIFTTVGTTSITFAVGGTVEYLVIGGGGGGGGGRAGGGGAGGYRCSVQGELSGSNSMVEARYSVPAGTYSIGVGAGGAGGASLSSGAAGGNSWFADIVAMGGGGGKERNNTANANGGSGGGGGYLNAAPNDNNAPPQPGGSGTAGQGFKGGSAVGIADGWPTSYGGGGGGAGSPGTDGKLISEPWGSGGTGLVSSISGVAVKRAGGGGGNYGGTTPATPWGVATNYGGGVDLNGRRDGASNTGGGGGANWYGTGGNGGSGIVILRYPVPAITVSDTSHGFGVRFLNTTGTWSYTVSGSALSDNITVSVPSPFAVATNGGTFGSQVVLTPNAAGSVPDTTIIVRFIPTAEAVYSGAITNASAGANDKVVTLTGTGIPLQPLLTVAPTSLDLGNVITNKTSTPFSYAVSGVELQGDVTVTAPAYFAVSTNASGPFDTSCVVSVTPPTLPDTPVYVRFAPSAGTGPYAGSSITNSSAGAANRMVAVTGTGVAQRLYVSAASLNFGNVGTAATSNLTYVVWGSNLEADVTLTVPGGSGFLVKTNGGASFGTSVTLTVPNQTQPAGGTMSARTIVVQFSPTVGQAYNAAITAASAGAVSKTTTLSGTGVVQQIAVQQPAGTALSDGGAPIVFAAAGQVKTFVVTNSGAVVLTLTGITKDGNAGDFTVGGVLPASLAAGASTNFTVTFTPTDSGVRAAGLHIGNGAGDGSFDITLRGTAEAGRFLAFGGDVLTVITNYPGTATQVMYGVHQYTNVGSSYFSPLRNLNVQYLVIGGGGGAGGQRSGGGGAGGYRCSVPGEFSGSNSPAEAVCPVTARVVYPVRVGAGGAGSGGNVGNNGGDSLFTNIVAIGGGRSSRGADAGIGGSGGGGSYPDSVPTATLGASGTAGQGFNGGNAGGTGSSHSYANSDGGGGGGAGGAGKNGATEPAADSGGGPGLESAITGTPVKRAGGGQGAYGTGTSPGAAYGGGLGGQGTGSAGTPPYVAATPGAPNTGGGGGGGADVGVSASGAAGGSGVVILRYAIPPPSRGTVILVR